MGLVRACIVASACAVLLACGAEAPPKAAPSALVTQLHRDIAAASNYDASQLDLDITGSQIVVRVINSNLLEAGHPDRDADAARIAHALEQQVATRAELARVQAIHVDYLAREAGGTSSLRDSMDYRRNPSGRFVRDVS